MKQILIVFLALITFSCRNNPVVTSTDLKPKEKAKEIEFKATTLGAYYNYRDDNDSNYYYIVEVRLINNTNSRFEFFSMTCSSSINIISDCNAVNILNYACSHNVHTIIRLEPKQEYYLPIVLLVNMHKTQTCTSPIRLGFIVNQPKLKTREGLFSNIS
jgi:hypothetical protein